MHTQVVTEKLSPEAREKLGWNPEGPDGKNKFPPAFYTLHNILFGVRLTYDGRIAMGTGKQTQTNKQKMDGMPIELQNNFPPFFFFRAPSLLFWWENAYWRK